MSLENVIIVGSGPAAHTAAIYTARAQLSPLLFEGFQRGGVPGGQLMITHEVENFPGFPEGITGPELMERCKAQSLRFGTRIVSQDVEEIDVSVSPFRVLSDGTTYTTRALIVATGARARYLGLPSETRLMNAGVSACATCDGALPMFRQQPLVVVGGGDSAMEETLFLTRFASKVHLVHRRESFRASQIMQSRVKSHPKVEIHTPFVVEEILGKTYVEGVRLSHVDTHAVQELAVAGVFVAIGHVPNSDVIKGDLEKDAQGYLVTNQGTHTSIPGVFVCGDVQDHVYRQAITAAGSGCQAAIDCERWLQTQEAAT
jgi:thioredoxin reductase (NADPH)